MSFLYLTETTEYLPNVVEESVSFNLNYTGNLRNHKYYTLVVEQDGAVISWVDFTECGRELSIQSIEQSVNRKSVNVIEELMVYLSDEFPASYVTIEEAVKANDLYQLIDASTKKTLYLNEVRSIIGTAVESAIK